MVNQDFNEKEENEILGYLTKEFGLEVFTPGLERTRPVYLPFIEYFKKENTKVVIVAGTNGKGQTAHTLASFISKSGGTYALWTSPHILSIKERFIYRASSEKKAQQASEISYEELKMAMSEGRRILREDLSDLRVSFYEFLFLVFLIMAKNKGPLDYLVLEVGLGGRLDAVNHFDADCACITSISRDHQSILGNRYDQILLEKIGVSRSHRALFTNFNLEYLNTKTAQFVRDHNVVWYQLKSQDHYFRSNQELAWEVFNYIMPANNLVFAEAIRSLPTYKGRREIMTFEGKSLIFIGAHNIDGVRRMLQSYLESDDLIFPESLLVSFSQRPIGEVEVMLKSLVAFFDKKASLTTVSFDHPKALGQDALRSVSLKINKGMLNFAFDWKSELKNQSAKTILVCGSYYFIGEVQRFIRS